MKRLQFLLFLLFVMGVGVAVERASLALYQRGSKVDWAVVKKALIDDPAKKDAQKNDTATVAASAIDKPADPTTSITSDSLATDELAAIPSSADLRPRFRFDVHQPKSRKSIAPDSLPVVPVADEPKVRNLESGALAISRDAVSSGTWNPTPVQPTGDIAPLPPATASEPLVASEPPISTSAATEENSPDYGPYSSSPGPQPLAVVAGSVPSSTQLAPPAPASGFPPPVATAAAPATSNPPVYEAWPSPVASSSYYPVDPPKKYSIYHLQHAEAEKLANSLRSVLMSPYIATEQQNVIVIIADEVSNAVLLYGTESKIETAMKMAKELDIPAAKKPQGQAMIRVEIAIAEVDRDRAKKSEGATAENAKTSDGKADDSLVVVAAAEKSVPLLWAEVTTLDNQTAQMQMSRTEPQVTGVARNAQGTITGNVNSVSTSTMIYITPRVEGEKTIVLNLNIEDSRSRPSEVDIPDSENPKGPGMQLSGTESFSTQTTVRLEDSKPMLLGGMTRDKLDRKSAKERLVTLTAHILPLENPDAKK